MIFKMTAIAGSVTGGMAATQECIDFCAEKGIEPEIELGCNLIVQYTYAHFVYFRLGPRLREICVLPYVIRYFSLD